jgi:acetylornithine deacetylase/succinyl-diaminopimelate desuccinylase-like protein
MNLQRIEPLPLNLSPPQFDASNAHQKMIHLSKKFSNRVTWGESRKKAANWIKDEFQGLGYTPKSLGFSEVIAGTQYNQLENIYVEKRGSQHPNEIVVAMAHYDITDTTKEGAMDDASGVGVVLELARVFSKVNSDRTLIFLLTDSEEFGAFWGARAFANSYERADQIVAALNFDFISPGKITSQARLTWSRGRSLGKSLAHLAGVRGLG